jgi:drug/metabolite transporter (DMT)-like permease
MMSVGLFYTNTSVYQMISGIVVVFNALLATIFLKQKLYLHHWLGITIIVIGTGIVGVSSYLNAENDPTISRNPLFGNSLVLLAQILAASLSIIEEKLFLSYSVEPLQVLGWEGFWGIGLTSFVLFSLYWIPGDDFHSTESAVYAFSQLSNDWRLLVTTICQILSIAIFNFFGISITKRISSTTRSVLESCRTLFVWIVSLAVGWETFQWLQLIGFAVLVLGMFLFNEVIQIPYYHKWYLKQKAVRDHVD